MNPPVNTTDDARTESGGIGIEVLRRLLFVGGVLGATWLMVAVGGPLWRVKDVRFEESRKAEASRMDDSLHMMEKESGMTLDSGLNTAANSSLDDYIAEKTKDALIRVDGSAWQNFANDVEATLSGKSTVFASGLSTDTGESYLYFPAATDPLAGLATQLKAGHVFSYISLTENGRTRYLEVLRQPPRDAARYAPAALVHPARKHAVWVFLAAVLAYAFLPWPTYGPRTLSFSRNRAIVVPDILGATMTAVFFGMPIFVIADNYDGPLLRGLFDFEYGWVWLTIVMWSMALLVSTITLTALWYAVFRVTLRPQGIRCQSLLGTRECDYAEIAMVEPAVLALPGWLRVAMMVAGLLNWRLMGAIWIGANQEMRGITVRCKDGRNFKIWLDYLDGARHVLLELRRANVPMAPALVQYLDESLAEDPDPTPWPNAVQHSHRLGPVLVVLAVALALGLHFWPSPPRKIIAQVPVVSVKVAAQHTRILQQMTEVKDQMDAAMRRYQEGPPANRKQELETHGELMQRFDELTKEYDAVSDNTP